MMQLPWRISVYLWHRARRNVSLGQLPQLLLPLRMVSIYAAVGCLLRPSSHPIEGPTRSPRCVSHAILHSMIIVEPFPIECSCAPLHPSTSSHAQHPARCHFPRSQLSRRTHMSTWMDP